MFLAKNCYVLVDNTNWFLEQGVNLYGNPTMTLVSYLASSNYVWSKGPLAPVHAGGQIGPACMKITF